MSNSGTPKSPKGELARLKRIFDILDRDGDGAIPLKDFKTAMADESATARELTDGQRQTLLRKADRNEDGTLNFREFALLTTSRNTEGSAFRRFLYRIADVILPDSHKPEAHAYLNQYTCCPPPMFMIIISIVEFAVFLYYTTSQGLSPGWIKGCGGCFASDGGYGVLPFVPSLRYEAWRFVTYMLVHAGIQHLLGNVILQLLLGIPLELVHTILKIGPLYFAGVILGAMLQYSLDPNVMLVGASGGVYALILAHLANIILNWADMQLRWFRLLAIVAYIGFDLGHVIYRRIANECDQVSYTAHVGGALAGLLLGILILKNIQELKWEKILKWVGLALFLVMLVVLVIMTIVIKPGSAPLLTTKCK